MNDLRPFFRFYGGKWRAAPKYPAPEHDTIVEPFAGAAGYATRFADRKIVLVEKDPVIAGIWRWLIRATPAEILALKAPVEHVDDTGACPEAKAFIGFWLNNATTSPCLTPSAWTKKQMETGGGWGPKIRERTAAQVDAIKHWRLVEGSFESCDVDVATWFVDPPYASRAGRYYKHNRVDYPALGAWCMTRRGQVIVCEQAGAAWLPFRPFAILHSAPGDRPATSEEVIWTGGLATNEAAA